MKIEEYVKLHVVLSVENYPHSSSLGAILQSIATSTQLNEDDPDRYIECCEICVPIIHVSLNKFCFTFYLNGSENCQNCRY